MEQNAKFESLVSVLKNAYKLRAEVAPSAVVLNDEWEEKLMQQIHSLSRADNRAKDVEEESFYAPLFLRFSFGVLIATIILHVSYQVSPIEQAIVVGEISKLDPFYIASNLYE